MARQQQRRAESVVSFCEFIALAYTGAKQSWIAFGMICALSLIIWWAFFRKSTCDVANNSNGRPCADIAYGCLRACYRPAHKRAKRRALLALLVPGKRVSRSIRLTEESHRHRLGSPAAATGDEADL